MINLAGGVWPWPYHFLQKQTLPPLHCAPPPSQNYPNLELYAQLFNGSGHQLDSELESFCCLPLLDRVGRMVVSFREAAFSGALLLALLADLTRSKWGQHWTGLTSSRHKKLPNGSIL